MKASLQQQIAPIVATNAPSISDAKVIDSNGSEGKSKIDFKALLTGSMEDVKKEREARKNSDFSEAKTNEEFLQQLSESTAEVRTPKNHLDKDDFLKLFVAQLQHQDPLNPDDGAEMASKLAQFNGVEQMMNVNASLKEMLAKQTALNSLQLANYIGKEIDVTGGRFRIENGQMSPSEFKTDVDAVDAVLQVRDASGMLITEQNMGTLTRGSHRLGWDGINNAGNKAADGVYTYTIDIRTADGSKAPLNIKSKAIVSGVDINNDSQALYSNLGKVEFQDVVSIGTTSFLDASTETAKSISLNHANASPSELGAADHTAPGATANVAAPQNQGSLSDTNPVGISSNNKPGATTQDRLEQMRAEGNLNLTPADSRAALAAPNKPTANPTTSEPTRPAAPQVNAAATGSQNTASVSETTQTAL